jgi:hypothetical protein
MSQPSAMYRHRLYVDGAPHEFTITGDPVHVEAAGNTYVDFWTLHAPRTFPQRRMFQAFGTGQPLPGGARYIGTTGRTPAGLIWHLFEIQPRPLTITGDTNDQPGLPAHRDHR